MWSRTVRTGCRFSKNNQRNRLLTKSSNPKNSRRTRYSGVRAMLRRSVITAMICALLPACTHVRTGVEDVGTPFNPLASLVQFYQGPLNHLSAVRRGECPMYPGCSEYCKQSMQKHGPLMGWMMACERLMRCGRDEIQMSPKIFVKGKWKSYDPVENNDVWWNPKIDFSPSDPVTGALPALPPSTLITN